MASSTFNVVDSQSVSEKDKRPNNRFECPICKQRFWSRSKYDDHVATHDPYRVSCNICSKTFYDKKLLDEHYVSHNNVIKTYDCEGCDRKFLQKHQLQQHMLLLNHTPVGLNRPVLKKKKSVRFNKVTQVKNIIDDTSTSEEFYTSDSEDDEVYNSDFEDSVNKISPVTTRSGRTVKRKKIFDEDEETEVKCKSPKKDQAHITRPTFTEYKNQKHKTSQMPSIDTVQKKSPTKTKQIYARKSSVIEWKDKKALEKNNVTKCLKVVIEKMPDHIYAEYVRKGNIYIENLMNSGRKKSKVSVSDFRKYKLKSPDSKAVPKVVPPHSVKSSTGKRSKTAASPQFTNKNVNNTPLSSKTGQTRSLCDGNNKIPDVNVKSPRKGKKNAKKSISSQISPVPHKSQTCKEYVYIGPKPDFRKIKKAVEEVSTMSSQETSVSNNSQKLVETKVQNKKTLKSQDTIGKSGPQLTVNAKPDQINAKGSVAPINSLNSSNSLNPNQLNGSMLDEEGILEKTVVGEYTVVKVTPEYMKKIQNSPIQNLQLPGKKMTEILAAPHLNSDVNKTSTAGAKDPEVIKENHELNAVTNHNTAQTNIISNDTNISKGNVTEIPFDENAGSKLPQHSKELSIPSLHELSEPPMHGLFTPSVQPPYKEITEILTAASTSNKNSTTVATQLETVAESEKPSVIANTSLETDTTKTSPKNTATTSAVDVSNSSSEHSKVLPTKCVQSSNNQTTGAANTSAITVPNLNKSQLSLSVKYENPRSANKPNIISRTNKINVNQSHPSSLTQTPVLLSPVYFVNTPTIQNSAVSFGQTLTYFHTSTPAIQSPAVPLVFTPTYSVVNSKIQKSAVAESSAVKSATKTFQANSTGASSTNTSSKSPQQLSSMSSLHELCMLPQTGQLPSKECETPLKPFALNAHKNSNSLKITRKTLFETSTPVAGTSREFNKNNNTKMITQSSGGLQVRYIAEKPKPKSVTEPKTEETRSSNDFIKENPVTVGKKDETKQTSIQTTSSEPDTTDSKIHLFGYFKNNNIDFNKNTDTQMSSESNLGKLQVQYIELNPKATSIIEPKTEETHSDNDFIGKNPVTVGEKGQNKQSSIQTTSSEPDTTDSKIDLFGYFKNNNVEFNKNTDTQMSPEINLGKLQVQYIELNPKATSVIEPKTEETHSDNDFIGKNPVTVCEIDENKQSSIQTASSEPKTTDSKIDLFGYFKNNNVEFHKNTDTQMSFESDLGTLQVQYIELNPKATSIIEPKTEETHSDNDFIGKNPVTVGEIDENKQSSIQTASSESETTDSKFDLFGYFKNKNVEKRHQKILCNDDKLDKSECGNNLVGKVSQGNKQTEISLKENKNVTSTADKEEIAKESPIIITSCYSFEVDDSNLSPAEITLDKNGENIQTPSQSFANGFSVIRSDSFRTRLLKSQHEKKLRSSANKCSNSSDNAAHGKNEISPKSSDASSSKEESSKNLQASSQSKRNGVKRPDSYRTKYLKSERNKKLNLPVDEGKKSFIQRITHGKNTQISDDASSSKTVKKQNAKQNRTELSKLNQKESSDVKNQPKSISKNCKSNENREFPPKNNQNKKSAEKLREKLLERYQAKIEEKERKKKEKYELKKRLKYVEKILSSPAYLPDSDRSISQKILPYPISIDDVVILSDKCATETKEKTKMLPIAGNILTMPCSSKSGDSFGGINNDSQQNNEPDKPKLIAQAIAKARSINLKFNKDLTENESVKLLEELEELTDAYNIGYDKCPFLSKTIRFCSLFVDSYKVRQKAISLGSKLKNRESS